MIKNNNCIDCGTLIWPKQKQCCSCYHKTQIKIKITYCCADCGDKISLPTALYGGNGRCQKCSHTGLLHSRLGAKLSKKTKEQISNSLIGKMAGGKCHLYKDGRCSKQYFCKDCNRKITIKTGLYGKGFCKRCWGKGKRNPNYNIGISNFPYSLTFNYVLKNKIRKRDKFKCVNCNITERKHIKLYGLKLSIHHIDYNKQNCNEMNLVTTCNKCNSKANFNRDYWYAFYTYLIREDK